MHVWKKRQHNGLAHQWSILVVRISRGIAERPLPRTRGDITVLTAICAVPSVHGCIRPSCLDLSAFGGCHVSQPKVFRQVPLILRPFCHLASRSAP